MVPRSQYPVIREVSLIIIPDRKCKLYVVAVSIEITVFTNRFNIQSRSLRTIT